MRLVGMILAGLLLAGVVSAQVSPIQNGDPVFMNAALFYLWDQTPAFAGVWGDADASAAWIPFLNDQANIGKMTPYTFTQVAILDPTGGINEPWEADPSAAINATSVAVAGLADGDGFVTDTIKDTEWKAYALASGVAQSEVMAVNNAWTIGTLETDASVTPVNSWSASEVKVYGIADFDGNP